MKLLAGLVTLCCPIFGQGPPPSWQPSELIWNFGIVQNCDRGVPQDPYIFFHAPNQFNHALYQDIPAGAVVWVKCSHLKKFCNTILPKIKKPFVLVISGGDDSFPSSCGPHFDVEKLLKNKTIGHIFAQNCDYRGKSKKVSPLPIGLDYHSMAYVKSGEKETPQEQEAALKDILQPLLPTHLRKKKAFADFQHSDTLQAAVHVGKQPGENRTTIFQCLQQAGVIDSSDRMPRSLLWKTKGEYAFSISPHGNGLDCHRTWEDLVLGCIVIVKTSPLDPLYEGLPVVIVQNWSEVTEGNMEQWLQLYGDAFTNPSYREKLFTRYWMNRIRAAAAPFKKGGSH